MFCFYFRHWGQFDLLVREVLYACRYKIEIPDEESVFEHFFTTDCKFCPKNTMLMNSIPPKVCPEHSSVAKVL